MSIINKKILIIGASAETGFLNQLKANDFVSFLFLTKLFLIPIILIIYFFLAFFQKTDRLKYIIAKVCQQLLSKEDYTLFDGLINKIKQQYGSIQVDKLVQPLIGLYNFNFNLLEKKLTKHSYDYIFIHLGGNDILNATDHLTLYNKISLLSLLIKKNNPNCKVIFIGLHNISYCLFNKNHLLNNHLYFPFNIKISINFIQKIIGFNKKLNKSFKNDLNVINFINDTSLFINKQMIKSFNLNKLNIQIYDNFIDYEKDVLFWSKQFCFDGFHPNKDGVIYLSNLIKKNIII